MPRGKLSCLTAAMFPRNLSFRAEPLARRLQKLYRAALDFWSRRFNPVVEDYFELAQGCSMRICPELEMKFPHIGGGQLELMIYLCLVAHNSEIYDGLCDEAWLRTTIRMNDDQVFSNRVSREFRLKAELYRNTPMCQSSWEQLEKWYESTLTPRIEIRWNILPRRAYWERLQDGFIPITVINEARQKGSFLKEEVDEWRTNGGRCDLASRLQSSVVRPAARRASRRPIIADDIVWKQQLGVGAAATVSKVSWRNGTYAMKSFNLLISQMKFKERDIAARVLHPHIIHGFGYFEEDGKWRLLMEMLDTNLTKYAVEKKRGDDEPLFSREDTLDVMLQIASAVKHLHDNGVVHGDLKSDNIVLEKPENGRHFLAKVTDFGDAEFFAPGQPFKPGGDGTTKFAAPELLEWRYNRETVRLAHPGNIDVYSFGGVAHEVLTGYPAYFNRECNARDVIAGRLKPSGSEKWRNSGLEERFPVELIELVEQCWELLPEARPSFSRICEVLERCKSVVQASEDRAAEEKDIAKKKETANKKRAAELWTFCAMVFLFAFISTCSPTTEKSVADPFKFIALILFIFIVMSYVCRLLRCVVCKCRDAVFPVKVKVL